MLVDMADKAVKANRRSFGDGTHTRRLTQLAARSAVRIAPTKRNVSATVARVHRRQAAHRLGRFASAARIGDRSSSPPPDRHLETSRSTVWWSMQVDHHVFVALAADNGGTRSTRGSRS